MRQAILDLFLLAAVVVLAIVVIDYSDFLRFILPTYELLKEHALLVLIGVGVVVGVKAVSYVPQVRAR